MTDRDFPSISATDNMGHTYVTTILDYLNFQVEWSLKTFGPGPRTRSILDHIRKELLEIEAEPLSLEEWVDLVALALDGAWRAGHTPEAVWKEMQENMSQNTERNWPDWRTADPDRAIEHDRTVNKIRELEGKVTDITNTTLATPAVAHVCNEDQLADLKIRIRALESAEYTLAGFGEQLPHRAQLELNSLRVAESIYGECLNPSYMSTLIKRLESHAITPKTSSDTTVFVSLLKQRETSGELFTEADYAVMVQRLQDLEYEATPYRLVDAEPPDYLGLQLRVLISDEKLARSRLFPKATRRGYVDENLKIDFNYEDKS